MTPAARRIAAIGLSATGALLAAGICEVVLRLRTPAEWGFARSDAGIGYVLSPDHTRVVSLPEHPDGEARLRTNNLGLRRDQATPRRKPAGTRRVLVLGDSQSEGMVANPETYSARLERILKQRGHGDVEVLNAAASGYSPLLESLWLRERGWVLEPDVVVMALYPGNDVVELRLTEVNFGGYGPRFRIPSLARSGAGWEVVFPGEKGGLAGRADAFLDASSRLYALVRRRLASPPHDPEGTLGRLAASCIGCLQSLAQAFVAGGDPDRLSGEMARLEHVVQDVAAEARRRAVPFLVAVIPTKLEVEAGTVGPELGKALEVLGLDYDAAAFDAEMRRRVLAAGRSATDVSDLLPPLRRARRLTGRPQYWRLDWHLDPDGHRTVAEHLAPLVADLLSGDRAG